MGDWDPTYPSLTDELEIHSNSHWAWVLLLLWRSVLDAQIRTVTINRTADETTILAIGDVIEPDLFQTIATAYDNELVALQEATNTDTTGVEAVISIDPRIHSALDTYSHVCVELFPMPVLMYDQTGHIVSANTSFAELVEAPHPSDLVGTSMKEIVYDNYKKHRQVARDHLGQNGISTGTTAVSVDGDTVRLIDFTGINYCGNTLSFSRPCSDSASETAQLWNIATLFDPSPVEFVHPENFNDYALRN